ncbi:MAG: hypothetical protein LBV58_03815 [Acholeplasmatales bacterium]|jgi:vacuolar-type H+-ATPase subunit F/Vma7|nr:hypothetical protein [Acholeplasmatales bacterium]
MGKCYAVSVNENIKIFNSVGFHVFVVDKENARKKVLEILKEDCGIVVIDEIVGSLIEDIKANYQESVSPIILTLPIYTKGVETDKLGELVKSAIGINIF